MMTVMISKWVGDLFNISLYDIHVELLCIPFVESTPPQRHTLMTAADVSDHQTHTSTPQTYE